MIKAFGFTFHSELRAEIQQVADNHGLSPRGRKRVRQLIITTFEAHMLMLEDPIPVQEVRIVNDQ